MLQQALCELRQNLPFVQLVVRHGVPLCLRWWRAPTRYTPPISRRFFFRSAAWSPPRPGVESCSTSGTNAGGSMNISRISGDVYFHDEILRQTDLKSAALLLAECAEALGWSLAAFHPDIHQPTLPRAQGEFIGTAMGWRAQTVNGWVNRGLGRVCPIGRHCGETTEPFLWDCESGRVEWHRRPLPPEQQAVLQHYGNDVCGGVTVPVRRGGRTGYVSWCSREHGRLHAPTNRP